MVLRLKIHGRFRAEDGLGQHIPIKSKKARALLAYLALPPGKERAREELMALLWSDRGDEQSRGSLRQALSGLKRELGEAADALIITDEDVSLDADKVTVKPASSDDELLNGLHINDPAFEEWLRDERLRLEGDELGAASSDLPAPQISERPSIAVLPFANLSGDPEQEYFADGITDDIITELARYNSLLVIARNSSFHYKGRSPNIQNVSRELGVRYVVEGSVRRSENRIRITAQLIDAAAGTHLWAERYDRNLEDVFAVQDEVTAQIATMVPGHVELSRRVQAGRKKAQDLDAYDLMLRVAHLVDRDFYSPEIESLVKQALAIDPGYAVAHAQLAEFYAFSAFAHGMDVDKNVELARRYAETALKLDPNDPVVLAILAETYLLVGKHDAADQYLNRAIALNPNDWRLKVSAPLVKAYNGDYDGAVIWIEKATANEPFSADAVREVFFDAHYLGHQYELSLEQLVGWTDPPPHMYLSQAAALAQLDRLDEAREAVQRFNDNRPDPCDVVGITHAFARMCAKPEDGERWLAGFRKAGLDV